MDYITYLRKLQGYKWYKPILEGIIAGAVWLLGTALCLVISMLFILNGFGFKTISSDGGQLKDVIMVVVVNGLYIAFLIFMDKKYKWFERTELN